MPQVLDYLTSENTRTLDAARLAAGLTALGYRDAAAVLPGRRATLIAIAESVGKRRDGPQAVALMQAALAKAFGLDVVGEADAVRTFAAWRVLFEQRVRRF